MHRSRMVTLSEGEGDLHTSSFLSCTEVQIFCLSPQKITWFQTNDLSYLCFDTFIVLLGTIFDFKFDEYIDSLSV
jgi:hypothetical protein